MSSGGVFKVEQHLRDVRADMKKVLAEIEPPSVLHVTPARAAKDLEVSGRELNWMIRHNHLVAVTVAGKKVITTWEVQRMRETRARRAARA